MKKNLLLNGHRLNKFTELSETKTESEKMDYIFLILEVRFEKSLTDSFNDHVKI